MTFHFLMSEWLVFHLITWMLNMMHQKCISKWFLKFMFLYLPMILKSMELKGRLLIDGPKNPFHTSPFHWSLTSCPFFSIAVGWKDANGLGISWLIGPTILCLINSRIVLSSSRRASWMGNAWVRPKTKTIPRRIFMSWYWIHD